MGNTRKLSLFALLFSISGGFVFSDELRTHVVKAGDTISHIAMKYLSLPIYKPDIGGIAEIIKANPQLKNPNRIFPGMVINIPVEKNKKTPRQLASSEAPVANVAPTPTSAPAIQPAVASQPLAGSAPLVTQGPVPPVVVASEVDSGPDPVSHVRMESNFSYFAIDAVDVLTASKSTFLSGLSPEMHVTWTLDWNEKWSSVMATSIQSYNVLGDVSVNPRQMDNASGNRFGFEFGVLRSWNESQRTGVLLGFKEMLFVRTPTPTSVAFDKVGTPSLFLVQEMDLFKVKSAKAGLSLSAGVLLPGRAQTYTTKSGYAAAIELFIRHSFKRLSIVGTGHYGVLEQNSTLIKKSESQVGAGFGVEWKLGE